MAERVEIPFPRVCEQKRIGTVAILCEFAEKLWSRPSSSPLRSVRCCPSIAVVQNERRTAQLDIDVIRKVPTVPHSRIRTKSRAVSARPHKIDAAAGDGHVRRAEHEFAGEQIDRMTT